MTPDNSLLSDVWFLRTAQRRLAMSLVFLSSAFVPATAVAQQWTSGPSGSISYGGGIVGIRTTNPAVAPLEVSGKNAANANLGSLQIDDRGDGCCSQLKLTSGSTIWDIYSYAGYMNGAFSIYGMSTHTRAQGVGNVFNILDTGNVGIGVTNPAYRLTVEGTIGARDVMVTNATWSDYVFQ